MAYRKMETQVPSFLDEFLDQIQPLPAQVKAKFAEMRELDDRAVAYMSEAERAAADAVQKAGSKTVIGNDPIKKAFQDLLSCQAKAAECSSKKLELAENSYRLIGETISSLDDKLRDYEAQLKKEGRWPASNKNEGLNARKLATERSSVGGGATEKQPTGDGNGDEAHRAPSAFIKSRKRDREREKVSVKRQSYSSANATEQTVLAEASPEDAPAVDESTVILEDVTLDPNEPRYCTCNDVSYGEMVACEAKNCPYEWFHYGCVGLTADPKGTWICPECRKNNKRKRG
jgi:inhibitor of growth protein 5